MNEGALRALRVAVVVMGVLIVLGIIGLVAAVSLRSAPGRTAKVAAPAPNVALTDIALDEPPGTHIAGVSVGADQVAVQLQGGGPDRVVVLDPRTGGILRRIRLAH